MLEIVYHKKSHQKGDIWQNKVIKIVKDYNDNHEDKKEVLQFLWAFEWEQPEEIHQEGHFGYFLDFEVEECVDKKLGQQELVKYEY